MLPRSTNCTCVFPLCFPLVQYVCFTLFPPKNSGIHNTVQTQVEEFFFFFTVKSNLIDTFVVPLILYRVTGGLEPIPGGTKQGTP